MLSIQEKLGISPTKSVIILYSISSQLNYLDLFSELYILSWVIRRYKLRLFAFSCMSLVAILPITT